MSLAKDGVPVLLPGDWVTIGCPSPGLSPLKGVVVQLLGENVAEIVYLDHRDRAINEEIIWNKVGWDFRDSSDGGYADKYDRLREFVNILRSK